MQESLDYRGLRRWLSLPVLVVLFPLSAALIGSLLGAVLAVSVLGFSALAITNAGVAFVAPIVGTIVLGACGAMWGLSRAKAKTLSAFRAVRLSADHRLTRITADLAAAITLPTPEVYAYEADDINAWATGSSASNAAIGMSTAAMERLSDDALAAIVAHELGHIASGDMVRMQMAISFQNATVFLAGWLGMRTPARNTLGLIGEIGVKWLSRRREYWADALGAVLTDAATMTRVLRSLERETPSSTFRKRHNLLFHWNRGLLLASHPSVSARCNALQRGAFVASVERRLKIRTQSRPVTITEPVWSRPVRRRKPKFLRVWNELSDGLAAGIVFVVALPISIAFWSQYDFTGAAQGDLKNGIAQVERTGPRVAAWSQEVAPELPKQAKPLRDVTKTAALAVYPKEPRYEPDDAMGDGDLTPYQLLVEEGVACIYRAKINDSYGSEHLEDAGPDQSDLFMYTYPASEAQAGLILGLVNVQATACWKKLGGVQREKDMMKRVQQPYDIWVLADAKSGATAECGIWPVARNVRNGKGGIAAYCR